MSEEEAPIVNKYVTSVEPGGASIEEVQRELRGWEKNLQASAKAFNSNMRVGETNNAMANAMHAQETRPDYLKPGDVVTDAGVDHASEQPQVKKGPFSFLRR